MQEMRDEGCTKLMDHFPDPKATVLRAAPEI